MMIMERRNENLRGSGESYPGQHRHPNHINHLEVMQS